jgi:hypothetical protein
MPADLSGHRVLSLRYRLDGVCKGAVARLVNGLVGWVTGIEYVLPSSAGHEHAADDPPVDPAVHLQGRWPDSWFGFTQGLNFRAVEAFELVVVGLKGEGTLWLDEVQALCERRPAGPWNLHLADGDTDCLGKTIPWDGSLELVPEAGAVVAEIRENSGALVWTWRYDVEQCPVLRHGPNEYLLHGLPPGGRVEIRVDRLQREPARSEDHGS